jgi:ABC-type multidrug transport system fused ATPase/permease subunit
MSSALHSCLFSNILYSPNLVTLKSATMQEAMDPRPFCVESFPCSSNHVQNPTTVVACSVVERGRRTRRRIFLPVVVNVESSNNNCLQASLSLEVARRSVAAGVGVDGATAATPIAIQVQNLGLSLSSDKGEIPVLKDCSLRIPEGQLWMLLGPNGCGKSTILKASPP